MIKKFIVPVLKEIVAFVTVEAEDAEEAISIVEFNDVRLSNYAGNGKMHGKLIGTSESNVELEICEGSKILEDEVEEVKD